MITNPAASEYQDECMAKLKAKKKAKADKAKPSVRVDIETKHRPILTMLERSQTQGGLWY